MIEDLNEKIEGGELSLEGVSLVTLDVDKMYNNITEDLGYSAVNKFLENRNQQMDGSDRDAMLVSSASIMEALQICLNFFSSVQ